MRPRDLILAMEFGVKLQQRSRSSCTEHLKTPSAAAEQRRSSGGAATNQHSRKSGETTVAEESDTGARR